MIWFFISQLLFVYGLVIAVTLSHSVAIIVTSLLSGLLIMFRIPPVDKASANEMLQTGKASVIAHRGGGMDAPENTLAAIRQAKENGADGVEFDVAYTKEGVAVLLHDDSVDRTTDGTGNIEDLTWEKVKTLDASAKDDNRANFPMERIPTLEATVELCLQLGLRMYIDCKADAQQTTKVIGALYKKYPEMYKVALVCSFYPQVVYMVRRSDPKIVTALIHRPWYLTRMADGSWQDKAAWKLAILTVVDVVVWAAHYTWLWFLCGNSAFSIRKDECCRFTVNYFDKLGVKVILWTVNDPVEKEYFTKALGCDIITDTLLNTT